MKPVNAPLKSIRLLDQVRERIRYLHYSLSTEKVYLHWVKFFIRWHGRDGRMRHPRGMGPREVEAFLTMLTTERKVSASTHNRALSAIWPAGADADIDRCVVEYCQSHMKTSKIAPAFACFPHLARKIQATVLMQRVEDPCCC